MVVADALRDDQGDPVAFLYGHVREFRAEAVAIAARMNLLDSDGASPAR